MSWHGQIASPVKHRILENMRVLVAVDPEIAVPPTTYGGIERIADALVRELRTRGHHVGLVANPASTCEADAFYPWARLRSQSLVDSCYNMNVLRKAAGHFKPDVIHSFSRILYMLPLLNGAWSKVMSFQREPTARTVRLAAAIAGNSLRFTGCSEYICGNGRRGGGEWNAIHNFVDTDFYRFQEAVSPDAPLVFLSRVERIKGAHAAIVVARRSGRRLIIAGNHGATGADFDYWEKEIAPQIGNGVEYVGPVNDAQKNELLGSAAAMIVPIEWNEPFGIVFAEALACGTPVISCPRGALPEIVTQGVHGFLINSVDEAVDAVARIGEIDRAACRKRAEEAFSSVVIAAKYESLYQEIRSRRRG
jgi:glycosyltransferase involved in cell wall biosynthesis